MSKIAAIIGRVLLAVIFIVSGANKLMSVGGTEQAIQGVGMPAGLAIPVGIFELVAGICLALGIMVRLVALLLFIFTALTILFFHYQITDPTQAAMAMKNLAIMGGLMVAFAHSQMWGHYYAIRTERKGELAARSAEERAHEAELRAARAEARAEGRTTTAVAHDVDGDGHADYVETKRRRKWLDW